MKVSDITRIDLKREVKYTLSSLLEWLNYLPGADAIRAASYPVWTKELPEVFDGLRIVLIADLHGHLFGKDQKRLAKAVRELQPDLILVAGDWVRSDYRGRDRRAILSAVRALREIAPVFGNLGNHEALAPHREEMVKELKKEGVRILLDQSILLKCRHLDKEENVIVLTGTDTPYEYYHGESAKKRANALKKLSNSMSRAGRRIIGTFSLDDHHYIEDEEEKPAAKDAFRIAIAHRPELLNVYAGQGFDLVLCGHAHGGLMRLPGGRRLLAPDQGLFPRYTHGMFVKGKTRMVISEGLGGPRILIRPQLVLLTLKRDQGA